MQNKSEFGGDFAKFINGLAGTVAGMSREAGESARERTREWIAGLDFVSREAVKEMAAKAREESESLKARVAALETALSAKAAGGAE